MEATSGTKRRARRHPTTLGPELEARLEAVRASRNPPPPWSALVRAAIKAGLPHLEAPTAPPAEAA